MDEDMKKTAVIFPGVGYTKDRPLLYYAGKIAVKCGYELHSVDFSGIDWSKEKLKDRDFLEETLKICLDRTEKALSDIDVRSSDMVFISKSIGTVVATAYAKERQLDVLQICFSPLELIKDYVDSAVLFCADADPYAPFTELCRIAEEKDLTMHRIEGGNHSLETGDVLTDIGNLRNMMDSVSKLLGQTRQRI